MKSNRKKGEDKLYQQWVKHGDLSPEAVPQKESPADMPVDRGKNEPSLRVLYILLGASMLLLCTGLVLLLVQSC
jgi:hypothetical protein